MTATIRRLAPILAAGFLILFLTACGDSRGAGKIGSIRIVQGAGQAALPGEEFGKEIRIELLGPAGKNLFGGASEPAVVPGVPVKVMPEPGSGLAVVGDNLVSDGGGCVAFRVRAGQKTGDKYITVEPEGSDKTVTIRFIVGAKLSGDDQEGRAGETLDSPLSIRLVKEDGSPAAGVPVYFSVASSPESGNTAKVLPPSVKTDANGEASASVVLGKKTGEYSIGVEVADPDTGYFIRFHRFRALGLDPVSVALTVIGGLAFFIFGMKLMADGLLKIAGENMKKILQFFSRNCFVAILAGTAVTAVVQSSSATTVMVIGFINAGLLTLRQSIGIIFGANIGTTVTAQIIAFNLTKMALPAVALGFLIMLSKRRVVKGWGETVLGFGLIFFGMSMMSNEMKLLGSFPSFVSLFRTFDCAPEAGSFMPIGAVLGAILIGTITTFIIQSSAAALGIVFALAAAGLINFYTAVPLLLGTNIGTTITAVLAAFAANRVAKQAALAHFLFNVLGTLMMMALFYVPYGPQRTPCFLYFINWMTPGDAFAVVPQNIERHIAMAHTFFNIMAVVILAPFAGTFTKLCEKILPIKAPVTIQMLEPHLLETPSIALEQVVDALRKMVLDAWVMVDQAVNRHFVLASIDNASEEDLAEKEKHIDEMQLEITNYLVQITRRELTQHQSGLIPLLMHCTNDAERIADHTENILKLTKRLAKTKNRLSDVAIQDLNKLWGVLNAQASSVAQALASSSDAQSVQSALDSEKKINKLARKYEKNYTRKKDVSALRAEFHETENEMPFVSEVNANGEVAIANEALENEREINQLTMQYEKEHVKRRNSGMCSVETSVIFVEMLWELEKLGDHLANIAIRTPEIQKHYIEL